MPIIMHDRLGGQVVMTLEQVQQSSILLVTRVELIVSQQLLPMSFGPDSLPSPAQLDALEKTS